MPRRKRRSKNKPFRLYAGDGGGCFGIGPAYLNSYIGHIDNFDAFIGTSIQSAACAGYALGKTEDEVYDFMKDALPRIFSRPWYYAINPVGPKWPDKELNSVLESFLTNDNGEPAKLKDAKKPLFVTAMNFKHDKPKVFNSTDPDDGELFMWEVVRCSVAANSYFRTWCPYHDGRTDFFTDGGTWANTPSCPGIAACVRNLGVDLDNIYVFSVGCGNIPSPNRSKSWVDSLNALTIALPTVNSMFDGGNGRAMTFMSKAFIGDRLYRFNAVHRDPDWGMDDAGMIDNLMVLVKEAVPQFTTLAYEFWEASK